MVSMPHLIDNIVEEIEQFREKGIEHCFLINICHLTTAIVLLNARREDEEKSTLRYLNMTTIATFSQVFLQRHCNLHLEIMEEH